MKGENGKFSYESCLKASCVPTQFHAKSGSYGVKSYSAHGPNKPNRPQANCQAALRAPHAGALPSSLARANDGPKAPSRRRAHGHITKSKETKGTDKGMITRHSQVSSSFSVFFHGPMI